jgi:hypothetical protein
MSLQQRFKGRGVGFRDPGAPDLQRRRERLPQAAEIPFLCWRQFSD